MGDPLRELAYPTGPSASVSRAPQASSASSAQQPVLRTLLVTDLKGFTNMLYALGDLAARDVIALHDELLRACLREYHGVERAHTGDGVIASFVDAEHALSCAAAMQRQLRRYNQGAPESATINVRIGLHAGRTLIHDRRLFGAAVNTAVRLCAVAGPGEVVLSEAVRALANASTTSLRDLGQLSLKGLPAPIRAFAFDQRGYRSQRLQA